eukprot:TRINITY_DN3506_c0_g2_i1.p1 TRINITY_DN3506_c0_g2~~TRINITY_DN3506_c0_g2_i1.p1  ORF type:complete len:240 (-),score=57.91 TRINITY_DN3506_c0_g2_i1:96-815(-)
MSEKQTDAHTQQHNNRIRDHKKLVKYLDEIASIKERLYAVRFDSGSDEAARKRDMKNLLQELLRLEEKYHNYKLKSDAKFEDSLRLNELELQGFVGEKAAQSIRQNVDSNSGESKSNSINLRDSRVSLDSEDAESKNPKLMRTPSTEDLKSLQPQTRWQSLFKMFREWKRQTNIAKAQYMAVSSPVVSNPKKTDKQIAQLRTAIMALREKKRLSPSDQELLVTLQNRLKKKIAEKHGNN